MFKTLNVQEEIEKEVVGFGNGSIVYTPKKWIGKKVIVILEKKPLNIKSEVMEILKPYLGSIEGVFLFGSFARKEQTEESDIDILVIAGKKIPVKKEGKFDFLVRTKEEFIREIKVDPTLFLRQIVSEVVPILNESLLKELRETESNPDFQKYLDGTLAAFKKTKEILDGNKNNDFLDANAPIYSLILRLKGLFIIQCHEKKIQFSNKKFRRLLSDYGLFPKTINDLMEVYSAERDERKTPVKILVIEAERLFTAAKTEFLKTEETVKK